MADDSDNKQKPKVTLIKKKKEEAAPPPPVETAEERKPEKKRVVVVKKRPHPAAPEPVQGQAHAVAAPEPPAPEAPPARVAREPAPEPAPPFGQESATSAARPVHVAPTPEPVAPTLHKAPVTEPAPTAAATAPATPAPIAARAEPTVPQAAPGTRAPTMGGAGVTRPDVPRTQGQAPRPTTPRPEPYRPDGTKAPPREPGAAPRAAAPLRTEPTGARPDGSGPAGTVPGPTAGEAAAAAAAAKSRTPLPFSVRIRENLSQFGGRPPAGVAGRPRYRPRIESRPAGPGDARPPYREGGGRSFGPRPPAPGAGGAPPAPGADAKKPGKKFFKSKLRYTKDKTEEEHEEKLQMRKREYRAANPVPKEIAIMEAVTVSELARKMNLKAFELISKLMTMGVMVTVNQQIDSDTASLLAQEYGCKVNVVSLYDETVIQEASQEATQSIGPRPPVVTIMGHVDHGKTKLLDSIRKADVVASEFGGITQHIGAYHVEVPRGTIAFLDTPGHEAFTTMRARGAQITDIVVLVVAADDGVMPQTVEAISHAREARVPIIVAVNKMDLPTANPERVKQQLSDYGLLPEEWGGKTIYSPVSALTGAGVPELLESILLQAEVLELKADYGRRAQGSVIEARIDHGRGIVATVLIQKGTLKVGDAFVAGVYPGRVRALFTDRGDRIEEATPSIPVEIIGLTGMPSAGDPFQATETEKSARQVGAKRQELKRLEGAKNVHKVTLDNLYEQIQQGELQELKVVLKADVHGSVEALQSSLEKLTTDEVKLIVILSGVGAINERDVMMASASSALVVGFHVRPTTTAQAVAEREKVEIRKYNIIYDAIDDIRSAMEGMLAPEIREETIGAVEVREVFKISRLGVIAGCHVTTGSIKRNAEVVLFREGVEIHRGKISSLKRFKDDVREVEAGYECGLGIEGFNDIRVADTVEVIEKREVAKKLGEARQDAAR